MLHIVGSTCQHSEVIAMSMRSHSGDTLLILMLLSFGPCFPSYIYNTSVDMLRMDCQ